MRNTSLLILVVLCAAASVQAAVITWDAASVDYSSPSDVSLEGTLVEAINACGASCMISPSINGVLFTASSTVMGSDACTTFLYGDTGDGGYNDLLNTLDYGSEPLALGGGLLEVGKDYLIQIWFLDERANYDTRGMQYGDGNGNLSPEANDQYVIGTFVADGATQTITVTGVNTGTPHITAYQIRELTSGPVPTLSTTAGETVSGNFTVDIDFTAAVTGLDKSDISVINGTVMASSLSGSGANWSVVIIPTANGDVSVTLAAGSVLDGDSHPNPESNTVVTTYVSPGSDQPVATLSTPAAEVNDAYTVQINFTEAVTGLKPGDFLISNGTLSNLSGSGASYSVLVTPTSSGDVTVSLQRNSVTDTDGDTLQNPTSNELVTVAHTGIVVISLAELRSAVQQSNQTIVMKPGNYNITELPANSRNIPCSGSNNTIDLSGVYVNIPVGSTSTTYITISGNNNTFRGGEFEDTYTNGMTEVTDFSAYNQDRSNLSNGLGGASVMSVSGDDNLVTGIKLTVRGSFPYGYGSMFGIGSDNVFGLDKRCGILITGKRNTIDNTELQQRAFGHGIYMQGEADEVLIRNTLVEGVVRPSGELYQETNSYDLPYRADYLMPHYDYAPIPTDEVHSLCEDGIRMYNIPGSVRVENCTVKKMRGGIRLYLGGPASVINSTAIDCGMTNWNMPTGGTITNSAGNFAYAPLSDFRLSRSRMEIEWTIIPSPHATGPHNLADILGSNHNIIFHRTPGPLDTDLRPIVVTDDNSTIRNETEYPIILQSSASGNTIVSCAPVTDNGTGNDIDQIECIFTTNSPYGGSPRSIPGRIEAEEYDLGGEGIGYHDMTAGNTGGAFRDDDVDIAGQDGMYVVGWNPAGEWLEYTVNAAAGTYDIRLRVATVFDDKQIAVTLDGMIITTVDVPNTGGWTSYQTVTVEDVPVAGGSDQILRVDFLNGDVIFDWIDITLPFNGDLTLDGKVDLEDVAVLSAGWQSSYTMDELLDIANNWLFGTE